MWVVNPSNNIDEEFTIEMAEGDFGIKLPIEIKGITFNSLDLIKIVIKNKSDDDLILEKDYTNILDNTIFFELTESDSEKLPKGNYVYRLDWYQNNNFMCNLIPKAFLKVINKI